MTIITYEAFFDFYTLLNYDDENGGYYDTKDTLCVQWRVDTDWNTGKLRLILWDDYHDKEVDIETESYPLDELTPQKCFDIYNETLKALFLSQEEDYYQIIEENFDNWRGNLKSEPTAEDFSTVTRLEGWDADTWEYVALP